MYRLVLILLLASCATISRAQTSLQGRYERADDLPAVKIDGEPSKIHTQGLFATDRFFLVTGRVETKPKRAVVLRFAREDLKSYEYVDITPDEVDGKVLDHPGGFDVDDAGRFWIPVSTSNREGPSLICCYEIDEKAPLSEYKLNSTIRVDDHIGAICCVGERLFGANWDTKSVYVWNRDGNLERKIDREKLFANKPDWQIAVQDWKHVDGHTDMIVLGGIDKSNLLRKSTIQTIDIKQWKIVQTHVLARRKEVTRPLTNEGLSVHNKTLFLLPEDIGGGAKVLQYKLSDDFP